MFAYCNNNPVNEADSNGHTSVATSIEQKFKYVDLFIYYHHPNSSKNMDDVAKDQVYSENAFWVPVDSFDNFASSLMNLPENTRNVYCYLHGDPNDLAFYQVTYGSDAIRDEIPEIAIDGFIFLFVCHGLTVADEISAATNCRVVATNEGVSFYGGRARVSPSDLLKDFIKINPKFWHITYPDGNSELYSMSIICW